MAFVKFADKWHKVDESVEPVLVHTLPSGQRTRAHTRVKLACCGETAPMQIDPKTGAMWAEPIDSNPLCTGPEQAAAAPEPEPAQ